MHLGWATYASGREEESKGFSAASCLIRDEDFRTGKGVPFALVGRTDRFYQVVVGIYLLGKGLLKIISSHT